MPNNAVCMRTRREFFCLLLLPATSISFSFVGLSSLPCAIECMHACMHAHATNQCQPITCTACFSALSSLPRYCHCRHQETQLPGNRRHHPAQHRQNALFYVSTDGIFPSSRELSQSLGLQSTGCPSASYSEGD